MRARIHSGSLAPDAVAAAAAAATPGTLAFFAAGAAAPPSAPARVHVCPRTHSRSFAQRCSFAHVLAPRDATQSAKEHSKTPDQCCIQPHVCAQPTRELAGVSGRHPTVCAAGELRRYEYRQRYGFGWLHTGPVRTHRTRRALHARLSCRRTRCMPAVPSSSAAPSPPGTAARRERRRRRAEDAASACAAGPASTAAQPPAACAKRCKSCES
jgi:hypothetical protein